jgi:hypothetical protein
LIPRPLASVIWKFTTGGLAIDTPVTAPLGASAANSVLVIVAASTGVPLGGVTVVLALVPPPVVPPVVGVEAVPPPPPPHPARVKASKPAAPYNIQRPQGRVLLVRCLPLTAVPLPES